MTLDERITKLLPYRMEVISNFSYKNIAMMKTHNECRDACATNLKQAFERREIAFVPSILDIAQAIRERKQGHPHDIPIEALELSQAEAILSLLTKGK